MSQVVHASADLVYNDAITPSSAHATETVTYSVGIINNGPNTSNNISLTINLPTEAEYVSHAITRDDSSGLSCVHDGVNPGGQLVCTADSMAFVALPDDGRFEVELVARVISTAQATIAFSGGVTAANDPDSNNNTGSRNVTVLSGADLAVDLTASPDPVVSGSTLTYTPVVTNHGPDTATSLQVEIELAPGFSRTGSLPSGCSQSGQSITCTTASLANGATWNIGAISGTATVAGPSTLTTTASISSTTADGITENNTASTDTTVNAGTGVRVELSRTGGSLVQFDEFDLRLDSFYSGGLATGLTLNATINESFEILNAASFSQNGWTCEVSGQNVSCTRANGGGADGANDHSIGRVTLNLRANGFGSNLGNTATLLAGGPGAGDSDSGNLNITVAQPTFELNADKSGPSAPYNRVVEGDSFNYTLRVRNDSNIPYEGTLTMTDVIASGLRVTGVSENGWDCTVPGGLPFDGNGTDAITCERTYTTSSPLGSNSNSSAVTLTAQALSAGTYSNQMCFAENSPGIDYPPNTGSVCNSSIAVHAATAVNSHDLRITKDSDGPVVAGEVLTYTIEIINEGPGIAYDVEMTDTFGSLFTGAADSFLGATVTANNATLGSCTNDGAANVGSRTLTCTFSEIPVCVAGSTCPTIVVPVRPLGNTSAGTDRSRVNTASAYAYGSSETNYTNNEATDTTTVTPMADLVVSKSDSFTEHPTQPGNIPAGTNLTYTVTVGNATTGASGASTVAMTDTLPHDVTFVSASASGGGSCTTTPPVGSTTGVSNDEVICEWPTLARNTQQTVTIVVRPNHGTQGSTLINQATVTSPTPDIDAGNNITSITTDVAQARVDLATTQTDNPDPLQEGDNVTYTFTVTNYGPSVAEDVVFYGVLPTEGLSFQSYNGGANGVTCTTVPNVDAFGRAVDRVDVAAPYWTNGAWNADLNNADLICQISGLMEVGQSISFTMVLKGELKGVYTNYVIARSLEHREGIADHNPGNDTEPETTTVRTTADMSVSKEAVPDTVSLREPFDFEVVVTNNGPGTAYGVEFVDNLPSGITLTGQPTVNVTSGSFGSTVCTGDDGDTAVTCDLGTVTSGATATITLPVIVESWPGGGGTSTTLTNTASVSVNTTETFDPVPGNNSDDAEVTVQRSSIAGRVYEDINFDGTYDGGEPGLGGLTLRLTGTDDFGNPVDITTVTASDGTFTFQNLSPSDGTGYTIVQDSATPATYLDFWETVGNAGGDVDGADPAENRIWNIELPTNTAATGYNFGKVRPGSITGWVFVDSNADGVRQGGETSGIPSLTMTLEGVDYLGDSVNETVTTGVGGLYTFNNILPGTYTLTQTDMPSGMSPTSSGSQLVGTVNGDSSGNGTAANPPAMSPNVESIVLLSNGAGENYNFGWSGQGLAGTVYVDVNRTGQFDPADDRRVAGVDITLSGATAGGIDVCAAISPEPCTVTTDASGNYNFPDLPASNGAGYTLTQQATNTTPLNNYADGAISVGQVNGGSSGSVAANAISGIVLGAGQSGADYNFGHLATNLSGVSYYDRNDNAQQDGGEPGLPGVEIVLSGTTVSGENVCDVIGGVNCTVTTDGSGDFTFPALPAGDYTLTQTQPDDYAPGTPTAPGGNGTPGTDNGNLRFTNISVPPGGTDIEPYRFANITGTLSGYVYHDYNADGNRDLGEQGLEGIEVTLSGLTASGDDICILVGVDCTVTTDADGYYEFTELRSAGGAGYTLTRGAVPDEYEPGSNGPGLIDGADCGACGSTPTTITAVPFDPAQPFTEFNFALVQEGSISGYVYHDFNDNSAYDEGEGLEGIQVRLTGNDDLGNAVDLTETTDSDGHYSFTGVRPSDGDGYTLTRILPDPSLYVEYPANGSQPGTVGVDPVGTAGHPDEITGIVFPSESVGQDFNFRVNAASLEGFVYLDFNDNGQMDAGEPGLEGVTVRLIDQSDSSEVAVTTTSSDGRFRFIGLQAGAYTLQQDHPAGYLDGRETAGTAGGTVNNTDFSDAPEHNRITDISLSAGVDATGYLFGERGGNLSGFVYVDENDDGVKDPDEAGLADVHIYLTGNTAAGDDIVALRGCTDHCVATTDADGQFVFAGLPPGEYELRKMQEQVNTLYETNGHPHYRDGQETTGVAGGVVNNDYFGSQPVFNTIASIEITEGDLVTHSGEISDYLFGVVPLDPVDGPLTVVPPTVSGYVYIDRNRDRIRPSVPEPDDRVAGWTVSLYGNDDGGETDLICQVVTDQFGFYRFDNVECYEAGFTQWAGGLPVIDSLSEGGHNYSSFDIAFTSDSGISSTAQSGGEAGVEDRGRITNIQGLVAGADIVEQNLPLDPAGVIYDAETRQPIAGATVSFHAPGGGLVNPACLVGNNPIITGPDGFYEFLLTPGGACGDYTHSDEREYTIQVLPPSDYRSEPSVLIPACDNTLSVGTDNPNDIQDSDDPPSLGADLHAPGACPVNTGALNPINQATTQYYFTFGLITDGAQRSGDVVRNHIPVDPLLGSAVHVTKTTPKVNVTRGELVPYTITARNTLSVTFDNLRIDDQIPPGFKYVANSAQLNGVPFEPTINDRMLGWSGISLEEDETVTIQLLLVVGSGVGFDEYVNRAWVMNTLGGGRVSNIATATVRVVPDPIFDCTDIIGQVFDDQNRDGYQNEGEPGIPGVRLVSPRGWIITTDNHGRFHVACADVPSEMRGGNFILKLDERSLPSGYRVTTENPRVVRVTQGRMVKMNFGAAIHRIVRLDLMDAAFDSSHELLTDYAQQLNQLFPILHEEPSILRIAYQLAISEDAQQARTRIDNVRTWIKEQWEEQGCCYDLRVEEEIVPGSEIIEVTR